MDAASPTVLGGYGYRGLHMTSPKNYVNYDQFAPNFSMAYKTIQRVSVPNLQLF